MSEELLDAAFLRRLEGLTLRARRLHAGREMGAKRTARRGTGLEFADHRAYAPGDDLRQLDWALLGRSDRPFVKTFVEERDLPVHLLVDTSRSMGVGSPAKLALALRLAAALGHVALAGLDRVGAGLWDGRGLRLHAPARGQGAFFPLLRFLAAARGDGPPGGAEALRLHAAAARPGLTVVFSDFLDRDAESFLRPHLHRRASLVLVQILAPEELAPDLDGDLELLDIESGARVEVSLGRRDLAAYRARLEAHRESLRRFARRYGAELFELSSDLEIEVALHRLLSGSFLA